MACANETVHLDSITHFFPTRKMVINYNSVFLENSSEYKITVIAIDIPPSDITEEFKEKLFIAICKCPQEKTVDCQQILPLL